VNGNISFNGQTIAETFNKYFVSVAQDIYVNNHNVNVLSNYENLTYPGHLTNHFQLLTLYVYHLKK
jgi:hypothetical protein